MEYSTFVAKLAKLDASSDDLVEHLHDLIDELTCEKQQIQCIEPILQFLADHPNADVGSPGPLVHLLEEHYPTYVQPLINSIQTSPSPSTIWMLNRIMNGKLGHEVYARCLDLLYTISVSNDFDDEIKTISKGFYDYQISRRS